MRCDEVIERLLAVVHQFKEAQGRTPFEVIVPSDMFAHIKHKLTDLRIDKNFQSGYLGSLFVRSDDFVCETDKIICYTPPEMNCHVAPGDFLPALIDPEVEKLRKHVENTEKEKAYSK